MQYTFQIETFHSEADALDGTTEGDTPGEILSMAKDVTPPTTVTETDFFEQFPHLTPPLHEGKAYSLPYRSRGPNDMREGRRQLVIIKIDTTDTAAP